MQYFEKTFITISCHVVLTLIPHVIYIQNELFYTLNYNKIAFVHRGIDSKRRKSSKQKEFRKVKGGRYSPLGVNPFNTSKI